MVNSLFRLSNLLKFHLDLSLIDNTTHRNVLLPRPELNKRYTVTSHQQALKEVIRLFTDRGIHILFMWQSVDCRATVKFGIYAFTVNMP